MATFPGLVSDVSSVIIKNCDTNSIIQLSGVNRQLNQALSNNKFFKNLFQAQHQALFDNAYIFTTLRSFHPSNCWKVMSQLMNSNRVKWDFPRRLKASFIEEAIPHFLVKAQSVKQQLTEQMKAICGSHYEDPNSPIDKAWRAYNKCAQNFHTFEEKMQQTLEEIYTQLLPVHPDDGMDIVGLIGKNPRQFQNISEEEFLNISEEERQGMSVEHLPLYSNVAELLLTADDCAREISNLTFEKTILAKKYQDLENDRYFLVLDLRVNDREISTFMENPARAHQTILAQEFRAARDLESNLMDQPHLKECSDLITQLIDDPAQQTPENLSRIRSLINACSDDVKKFIWSSLYYHCANSVIEDQWSEKHFQDHLPALNIFVNQSR